VCVCVIVYKSPHYESMGFRLVVERLVAIGYPEAIREFEYDHSFAVRSVCLSHPESVCLSLCVCINVAHGDCDCNKGSQTSELTDAQCGKHGNGRRSN